MYDVKFDTLIALKELFDFDPFLSSTIGCVATVLVYYILRILLVKIYRLHNPPDIGALLRSCFKTPQVSARQGVKASNSKVLLRA